MTSSISFLDRLRSRAMRRYWSRKRDAVEISEELRKEARKLRRILTDIERSSARDETKASNPMDGLPPATLWASRPGPWSQPVNGVGPEPLSSGTTLAPFTTIYFDGSSSEIYSTQSLATAVTSNPFELSIDIDQFDGSYISLAMGIPKEEVNRVDRSDLIRLDLSYSAQIPVNALARLNIKIGPNVEAVIREIDRTRAKPFVEFDLHYIELEIQKIEDVWIDVIFEKPGKNLITLHDLKLSRRPRAHS